MTYYDEEINGTVEQDMTTKEAQELGLSIATVKELEERNIDE
jgi:hypothetical protein